MNLTIISALVSAAIGFGAAWQIQAHFLLKKDYEYAQERIERDRAARVAIDRATLQASEAQRKSAIVQARLRNDAAGATTAADGVRASADAAVRAASANLEACTGQASALGVVFSQCTRELQKVAADADEWSNQAVTLQNAWPK